jgi:hypothetical protein
LNAETDVVGVVADLAAATVVAEDSAAGEETEEAGVGVAAGVADTQAADFLVVEKGPIHQKGRTTEENLIVAVLQIDQEEILLEVRQEEDFNSKSIKTSLSSDKNARLQNKNSHV